MGWDLHTYASQPAHFISEILQFMSMEVAAEKARLAELEQRSKLNHA